jgi:dipeptidase
MVLSPRLPRKFVSARTIAAVAVLWCTASFPFLPTALPVVQACTDVLVTPGASADGSAMIAYNADSPTLFGTLYHYPASAAPAPDQPRRQRKVYNWDTGAYLGTIDESDQPLYNVVGNSNEHGLVIGESTFGGVQPLAGGQDGAVLDYGSLIYVALQRCKTVREAIVTMTGLLDQYGYASSGESFSLTDRSGQVWMMELISRGNQLGKKGAVWVAVRIPDGSVAAHANQARITTFPRNNPDHCLYSEDVVDVAVHYGLYPADADPLLFSFSDAYDPIHFVSVRQGEARVWSIFSRLVPGFQAEYQSYALGQDLSRRMPLFVTPPAKLTVLDVMQLMNSHFEDTVMDSSLDVGSGLFASPYRPRPLVWEHNGTSYHNERSVATAKTGWNFVAQVRPWMPPELSALVWFAVDDSSTSFRTPVYGSATAVPKPYAGPGAQDGVVTPILQFDLSKAFWVQNMVSNLCYSRWSDVYPLVRAKIDALQAGLLRQAALVDDTALKVYRKKGSKDAVAYATQFGCNTGEALHQKWLEFYGELFVRFRDYYTIVPQPNEPVCGCNAQEPGMSEVVRDRIVRETGDHYQVVESGPGPDVGRLRAHEVVSGEQSGVGLARSATLDLAKEEESLAK